MSILESASPESHPEDFFDTEYDHLDDWPTTDLISENDFDMIDMLSAALDQVTIQLNEKRKEVKQKSSEWTTKTRDRIRARTQQLERRRSFIEKKLVNQYENINDRMNKDIKTVHLRDKISFVVGVGNACITPALTARLPHWIPFYYTIQSLYLLSLRVAVYKYRKWHYFIFDLCYFVNALTLLYVWFFPKNAYLFYAIYTLTSGPVAWAIVTWRNSLVFHSLDKVTSVFIHIFPALVTYVIRWLPELHPDTLIGLNYRDQRFPALQSVNSEMSFRDCMISSTVAYLIWQSLYFVFIMVKRREKVESGLRVTSYSWLLNETSAKKKSFIQKAAFIFGPKYKAYMFMLLQLVYNILTTIPTYFMFQYFWLHSIFLCTMFGCSVWNGANYYIEVFSRRYQIETDQAIKKKKLDNANNTDNKNENDSLEEKKNNQQENKKSV